MLPPNSENVLVFKHPNTATVSNVIKPWGIELNALYNGYHPYGLPFQFLFGVRYLNIAEDFVLNDAIIGAIPNAVVNVRDNFSTRNKFIGIQTGMKLNYIYQNFLLDFIGTLSLGRNFEKLIISGQTNLNNVTILQPIGLFAEPSNSGTFSNHEFAIVPELKAKVTYAFNECLQWFIAYDIFYINKIIRPGNQIDRIINQSQNGLLGGTGTLTGISSPIPSFNHSGMWIQGLSVGIKCIF
jgi:hypothetical protein